MKARIAIVAALPREIAPLVQSWPVHAGSRGEGFQIAECEQAIAVCAGMGRERAAYALTLAEARGPLRAIISAGYAGALHCGAVQGKMYWPGVVIDAETGERYACEGGAGTLVTVDHVVGRLEKPELAARWKADLVDMESAAVARLARARHVPFRTLRAVSDEAGDTMPDLNRFVDVRGGFREAAFARYIALHPQLIPDAMRLGRKAAQASRAMAQVLRKVLKDTE